MKKLLFLSIAMFAVAALHSCNDDEESAPQEQYDVDTVSTECEGIYFGDVFLSDEAAYTYYLRLGDKPLTPEGNPDPEGTYYILRLNTPLESNLAEGTYTTSGSSQYILTEDQSTITHFRVTKYIKEGSMTVSKTDGQYSIDIELTTEEGDTFHTTYNGEFHPIDKSIEWVAQDMNTQMTSVYSWYLEDEEYKNSNLNITLYENIDDAGWVTAPSSVLILVGRGEFNNDGELLPGTFSIVSGDATDNSFTQGECVNFMNAPFPSGTNFSYYYDADDSSAIQVGLAESGTVDIQKNGSDYTISYELKTSNGKTLTGSYTGPLAVQDAPKVIEKHEWDLPEDHVMNFSGENFQAQAFTDTYTVEGRMVWNLKLNQYDANWSYYQDQLYINIVCPLDEDTEPTPGIYPVSAGNEERTTMIGTYTQSELSSYGTGTYFQYYQDGLVKWAGGATGGQVEIIKNSDGTYTLNFDFLDGQQEPKHFSGSWTGNMKIGW